MPKGEIRFTPPDQQARDAARKPERSVVLRASAGTGKTTALTDRYLRLLGCGVRPRNILTLTFTREAAREMKDRIFRKLAEDPDSLEEIGGGAALAEVSVSTIDAFTLGLVREFPLDAGVSPGIEVLDERAMPAVMQQAIEAVLSGRSGFDRDRLGELPLLLDRGPATVGRMAQRYLAKRLVWRARFEEQARELARKGRTAPASLARALRPVREQCESLAGTPHWMIPLPVRIALGHVLADTCSPLDVDTVVRWCRLDLKTAPRGFPKELRADYLAVKARVRKFRPRWQKALNDQALPRVWSVFRAVEREYRRLKQERGVMDFDDLTETAIGLFSEMEEFSESRFRLEARYHHLLIDEFHDTSDAQWTLLQAIMEPWKSGAGLAAEEVVRTTRGRLSRPTVFVVGDPKQSIYRFRDARVEILGQAEDFIARLEGTVQIPDLRPTLHLRFNFRSHRRLRRFVNRASRKIASASVRGGADPDAEWAFRYDESDTFPEDSNPNRPAPPADRPVISVAVDRSHEQVAERVAERAHLLLDPKRAREREERLGLDAPVEPADIAILARANRHLGAYQRALEERGIPAFTARGSGFFESSEIRDIRALLRFLARPWSDLRAVEVLRSRLFAVSGEALAGLRRQSASTAPFADLLRRGPEDLPGGLDPEHALALGGAAEQTREWVATAPSLPPVEAFTRVLDSFGYADRARATAAGAAYRGEQEVANLRRALRMLRAFAREGFATMERLSERFEAAAANGDATIEPIEAAEAVQLLSIHAAKGLEYDHVFLVDCAPRQRPASDIPRVVEEGPGRWSIALVDDAPGWKPELDGGRGDAEERRCLYVAMTRARRTLSLSWVGVARTNPLSKPRGLTQYLPPTLYKAAMATMPGPHDSTPANLWTPPIRWRGEDIEVLPPPLPSFPDGSG